MGIAQRKEREKEFKRGLILEAAEELIVEKGHNQLNMDEVAVRAEVSKGTLYLYFKNKTDLVLAIVQKATSMLNARIGQVLSQDLPGIELVHQIGKEFLSFVTSHPEFFGAMRYYENLKELDVLAESEYAKMCQMHMHQSFTYTVRAIQIGMQDGTIDPSFDAKELATIIWSSSKGMVTMAHLRQGDHHLKFLDEVGIDVEKLFDSFIRFVGCGISGNGLNEGDS